MDRSRLPFATALLAVALLIAGCGGSAATEAPPRPTTLGLVANTLHGGSSIARAQDQALSVGARWLREEIIWERIEPRRGVRDWRRTDRLFADAARRGIRVLPLLNDAPGWATPEDGGLPTDTAAYGAFVRDAVARYGPGGRFWKARPRLDVRLAPRWFELWNEPYYVAGSDGDVDLLENAARYAALAQAGIAAGHAADPQARLLVALAASARSRPDDAVAWLDAVSTADPGVLAAADGYAAHPYGIVRPSGFLPLDDLIAQLDARGLGRPILLTEIGWSTCRSESECVTERQQAASLTALVDAVRTRYAARVKATFVYHLHDWRVAQQVEREGSYGLTRIDGSRKPAWFSFRRAAAAATR